MHIKNMPVIGNFYFVDIDWILNLGRGRGGAGPK